MDGPNGREVSELPPSQFRVNVAEAMALAVLDVAGVGALPLWTWTALPWLHDGTLTRVLPTYQLSEMQVHGLYTSREHLDAKSRNWIDSFLSQQPSRAASSICWGERKVTIEGGDRFFRT
ncbi:hypothetical protein E1N52_03140 [Paraburkholderia guartelaensis]|uniref:LysR substrate-binding domain-containing protein n=1 Tax=Paraburkholderia guartelaensis TaxID=2546446 RepID=A0A4R5LLH0_9BURK|nr:hypothetical protein E1N52_03140 [Paraburkholderia guartelaensis]